MGAVTYPNQQVSDFIDQNLIPVQVAYNVQPLATEFKVAWTPTIIILDPAGQEHQRGVGFQPPEEFIPFLRLGLAKTHFDQEQFAAALPILEELLTAFPQSAAAPEAVFMIGVCKYKTTHNPGPLKEAYERLKGEYPASEWTKRAFPYSML